jgi:lysyl-tRNA synthetase class 1
MSGSTGLLLKPSDLLEIYEPTVLLWIYARVAPMKAFDIAVDDQVLRIYDEFDRALAGEPQVESDLRALELSRVPGKTPHAKEEFASRLARAEAWIERYVPEQRVALLEAPNETVWATLSDEERLWIERLAGWIATTEERTIESATEIVYEIPKREGLADKELAAAQRRFFKIVYNLLFGRDRGPRLGTFLAAVPRERYLRLLDSPA